MSTIKVIAPLSPAGEFALADAENISLALGKDGNSEQTSVADAMNTMAQSLEDLEKEVGMFEHSDGEGNTAPSSSLSGKLNKVDERVESLFNHITSVKNEIAECLGYLESGETQVDIGKTRVYPLLTNIKDALAALIQNIGYAEAGKTSIRSQIEGLFQVLARLESNIGTESHSEEGNEIISEGLYDKIRTLQSYIMGLDDYYATIYADATVVIDSLNAKIGTIDNVGSKLTSIDSAVASLQDSIKTVSSNVSTIQSNVVVKEGQPNPLLGEITTLLQNNDSPAAAAVNTNLGTFDQDKGETVKSLLTDLRSLMNTMLPPTLETTNDSGKLFKITAKPKLTITVSVNRPLENPLKIQTDKLQTDILTDDGVILAPNANKKRSAEFKWMPEWQEDNGLPYTARKVIQLVNADDSSMVYATKTESCTFAEDVYYGASNSAACDNPTDLVDHNGEAVKGHLSNGHLASISFKKPPEAPTDGCYYYYIYPKSYGDPTITSGGLDAGFIGLATTWTNANGIVYNIYRSENKLTGNTTVSIK